MDATRQPDPKPQGRPSQLGRLKVHLRLLPLAGMTCRVVTLRPSTRVAFSTNYYHNTWHLVGDRDGSQMLARLLWGLSYQCQPGTLVLIHGPHLLPTPFEAERSDPFLLIPAHLTALNSDAFRLLKARLPHLGPPDGTIRWLTFGLDLACKVWREDAPHRRRKHEWDRLHDRDREGLWRQERMGRCGGLIYYTAPPPILRLQSLVLHGLRVEPGEYPDGMNYHFLAEKSSRRSWADGEVQIFADYRDRVAAAVEARRDILPWPNQPVLSETLQETISRRRDRIKLRKARCRKRSRPR